MHDSVEVEDDGKFKMGLEIVKKSYKIIWNIWLSLSPAARMSEEAN